eukprot:373217_1
MSVLRHAIQTRPNRLLVNARYNQFSTSQLIKPSIDIKYNQLFINGQFTDSVSGQTLPTIDPRNEETITNVSAAQTDDIDIAVNSAQKTFKSGAWSSRSGMYRSRILHKWADLIARDIDYLTLLETWDQGKPIT